MIGLLPYIRTSLLLRSAIVALLLGCVGIGVLGEWLVFKIMRSDIHQVMEERIKFAAATESELVIIKIPNFNTPKDFVFIEAGREFRYQGEMYDIVSQAIKGDTTYYHCIHDARETALYANLEQQMQDEFATNPERQKQQTDLLQKIPKFYFLATDFIFLNYKYHTQPPAELNLIFLSTNLAIVSPPPECA